MLFPILVFAQAAPAMPQSAQDDVPAGAIAQEGAVPALGAGVVNCFDFYRFGSVQADITAAVSGTVSGAPITFAGALKNTNPYPIVDGALYVKVFKKRGVGKDVNGPDVVDQFLVKGDIVIPANGSVPTSFVWKVPAYAESGDYQLATFFTTSRKFNLLGLSFTDDVVGNTVPFTVSGEQTGAVRFDKAGVTVAGQPYRFAAFPPRVSATSSVQIIAKVKNTSDSVQRAKLSWTIYQWDAQLRENAVQDIPTSSISIPAGGTLPVSVDITDAKYPVYLAVGTIQWGDTTSIVGIRFVRDGLDHMRINFPGVISYPLKAGQEDTIFSCLHNAGTSASVPDGRLDLTLSDMRGRVIHQFSYTGAVTGAMMGVADRFTPIRDYSSFVLDARLYRGNEFVDEAHLVYDCAALDPASCIADEDAPLPSTSIADAIAQYGILAIGVASLLVVVILAVAVHLLRMKPVAMRADTTL
jgi:hypothetical protein